MNKSLKILNEISNLEAGWGGYNAEPIPKSVCDNAKKLLTFLNKEPDDVFPSYRKTIQFEYDKDGKSLEVEIFENMYELLVFNDNNDDDEIKTVTSISDAIRDINSFNTTCSINMDAKARIEMLEDLKAFMIKHGVVHICEEVNRTGTYVECSNDKHFFMGALKLPVSVNTPTGKEALKKEEDEKSKENEK